MPTAEENFCLKFVNYLSIKIIFVKILLFTPMRRNLYREVIAMKRFLAVLFVFALMATGAFAYTREGGIAGASSEFSYSDLNVDENGNVSYILHNNSDKDVRFHGRLSLLGTENEDVKAETELISVPIMAKGRTKIETKVVREGGAMMNPMDAAYVRWSGVRIDN